MRKIVAYLGLFCIGVVFGALGVGLIVSPIGYDLIVVAMIIIANLCLGAVIFALATKVLNTVLSRNWNKNKTESLLNEVNDVLQNPATLPEALIRNRGSITDLGAIALSYFAAIRSLNYVVMGFSAVVAVGTLLTGYIQMERLAEQNRLISIQNSLAESSRRATLVYELSNINDRLTDDGQLSDLLVARIASLSLAFRPYKLLLADETLSKPLSPERGQLLLNLIAANVDTKMLGEAGATFSYSDLRGINLNDAELNSIDLSFANLAGARLRGASLDHANLRGATLPDGRNMYDATVNKTQLDGAITTDETWLDRVFFNQSKGSIAFDSWLPQRDNDTFYILAVNLDDEGNEVDKQWFEFEGRDNLSLTRYIQSDGQIRRQGIDVIGRFTTSWLFPEFSTFSEEQEIVRASLPELSKLMTDWEGLKMSDHVVLYGLPNLTYLFEQLATYNVFPNDAKFRSITPGSKRNLVKLGLVTSEGGDEQILPVDMVGIDLTDADLRYVDFGLANLRGANFSGALLPHFEMMASSSLNEANLAGSILLEAWPDHILGQLGYFGKELCNAFEGAKMGCYTIVQPMAPIPELPSLGLE